MECLVSGLLSKVIDRSGNNYVVNYTSMTGTAVPDTILWTPTSLGGATYSYTMKFNYTTNAPQSSIYGFVGAAPVSNIDLLSSITIAYSGSIIRNYVLGYQASPTTTRERLISVKECSDSGATICLLPTSIGYQNGAAGTSGSALPAVASVPQKLLTHYDLNGDGYPDLIYVNGATVYVAFGSSSGYGTPLNTTINASSMGPVGDLLGNGKDGILANNGGTWFYYTWTGSAFSGITTHVAYVGANTILVDVNGDGLPDFATWATPTGTSGGIQISTVLNTSAGGVLSFSQTVKRRVYMALHSMHRRSLVSRQRRRRSTAFMGLQRRWTTGLGVYVYANRQVLLR